MVDRSIPRPATGSVCRWGRAHAKATALSVAVTVAESVTETVIMAESQVFGYPQFQEEQGKQGHAVVGSPCKMFLHHAGYCCWVKEPLSF